jgi:RecQ family ATP-dependent DNA helicase
MEEDKLPAFNKILKKYYGFESLKPEQYDIINYILNNYDVIAMLRTGYGKSLIFIMIHLITKKNVLVISPLISLMNDQLEKLKTLKINAFLFNGTLSKTEISNNKKKLIKEGETGVIYITPEYFVHSNAFITDLYDTNNIVCITIDECHCISSFGLSFRPTYLELQKIKEILPNVPILGLSATVSSKVKEDIIKTLQLTKYKLVSGSFDRPNLYLKVSKNDHNTMDEIIDLIKRYPDDRIIIYSLTKDGTHKISNKLNEIGFNTDTYHAGMGDYEREVVQTKFKNKECKIIVCTCAFSMGIDLDIRMIIHFNCPKNIESYWQECGRAGRDGTPSECHMYFSKQDMKTNRFFLNSYKDAEKRYQEEQIQLIENYIYTSECRRKILLSFFGENIDNCNNCDNCLTKKKVIKQNFLKQTYLFISLLRKYDGKYGAGQYIKILIGRKIKEEFMELDEYKQGLVFGKEDYWKSIVQMLKLNDFIKEKQIKGDFGSTIETTTASRLWLKTIKNDYPTYIKLLSDINSTKQLLFEPVEVDIKVKTVKSKKTSFTQAV